MEYIMLKTGKRTSVYNHDNYLIKFKKDVLEIVRIPDGKVVDIIRPYDTFIDDDDYVIIGQEV